MFSSILDAAQQQAPNAHEWAHACHHGPHPFGIVFGVGLAVFVLFLVRRAFWRRRWGGFRHVRRRFLRQLFSRLDTSPSQEKVIREAIDEVRAAAEQLRGEGRSVREGVGKAFEGEIFDDGVFEAAFVSPEAKFKDLREAIAKALEKVHEVLTPAQRKDLAALIARGGFRFGGHHGHRAC